MDQMEVLEMEVDWKGWVRKVGNSYTLSSFLRWFT